MQDQAGFSLMEALVAIAVFATAATGLISLNTNSLRISGELSDRVLARQVAENIAVETITDPQLLIIGSATGEDVQRNRDFVWERNITPAPRPDLVEITIRVRRQDQETYLSEVTLLERTRAEQ
ncbi:type II secretion system minor pseudopilin GspI [Hyphomonas sp.]|uniref:type II secretion system minor pseudopilin GspI n=1 Tax=Hyphomonas sp. TaxID=87 RepID=UPI001BCE3C56|nr:type II secretion system minor pseudopilin GspI [Hyphomonas sp.]